MSNATGIACETERVMAASRDAMAVVEEGQYVSVDREYADLYGVAGPEDLAGESWADGFADGERARFEREILPACREEGEWRGEVAGRRRDGTTVSLDLSVAPLGDDRFVLSARPTDADDGAVPGEDGRGRLVEHVFDAVDDILYVLDGNGDAVLWNEKLVETTGYADAEIAAIDPAEFIPLEQREYVPGLAEAIDQLGDQRVELDVVTKDGDRVPHEFRGTTFEDPETGRVYRCGVARDVRDRREHERELERYETIVETVDDGVYALDGDLRVSFVNQAFCEMVDESREDLLETPVAALFEYEDEVAMAEEIRERVVAGETGTGTVSATVETTDGERSLEAHYTLHPEPDDEFRGSVGVIRDVTEREERERELQRERDRLSVLFENVPTPVMYGPTAADGPLVGDVNPAFEEVFGWDAEAVTGMPLDELIVPDDVDNEDLNRRVVEEGSLDVEVRRRTADGIRDFRLQTAVVPLDESADGFPYEGWAMYTDVTERKARERRLERQRDELETLDRINDLLLQIMRDLFASPTREEIEQTVCDHLASSDLYQFAWIGAPEPGGERIVPRTGASTDDGHVEAATITDADGNTGRGPVGRAFRTGTVQVSQGVRTDPAFEQWNDPAFEQWNDAAFEQWNDAALDRGIEATAAVPLVHGETTYGILAVYATRPRAFSRREQEEFETLGKAVGFAVNAIENRRLLFADSVVELEFEVTDPGLVFVRASERLACSLTVTGFVASETGDWSVYLTVDGAEPTAVRDVAREASDVEQVRIVADEGDTGLLEFVMTEPALNELTEHGAILTSGAVADGRGRFCVEAPRSTDVRRLSARLQDAYPESTLVAQREFDRSVQTAAELRQSLDERLTDRQREALDRAHHAGYFDWPRTSAAGDVADSMDVAETTFHYHLRHGLDTLLSALTELERQ